ncbi:hypothetical protein [Cognatazoarcus halotolerans]|uniref:hypothetical protein n=1 Tax=Cognatazoarcus halotolerans TaxID=2686016 RepID=UPI001358E25A|nr:hypothetical protein [Cognatazoarcus halotolerans]
MPALPPRPAPRDRPDALVILGSTVTGLAMVRDAHRLGLAPIVVDRRADIASRSRHARTRILAADATDAAVLDTLLMLASADSAWLIATSDAWLEFVAGHRAALDSAFGRILHPQNTALETCTQKAAFSEFCLRNALPIPARIDARGVREGEENLPWPLLVRPAASFGHRAAGLPKAAEVANRHEAVELLNRFDAAGVPVEINESLLGRPLVQYSVGAARTGEALATYVAIKRRPLPHVCAVGSYVQLSPQAQVEALARKALELLDYQGIAEVEILRDESSGACYLIEINARPWVQYPLGPATGHPLLGFMLDPSSAGRGQAVTTGAAWINLTQDAFFCFSRSVGHVRRGELSLREWLRSLARVRSCAYFDWADPKPAWFALRAFLGR